MKSEQIILYHKKEAPYGMPVSVDSVHDLFGAGWVTGPQYFDCPEKDIFQNSKKKVQSILSRPREKHDILPLSIASREFLENDLKG